MGDDEGSNQKQEEEQQCKTHFDEPGPHKLAMLGVWDGVGWQLPL